MVYDLSSIWGFLFDILDYIVVFGQSIIDVMNSSLVELVRHYIPLSFVDNVLELLTNLGIINADITFLQFILTVGAPFILVFGFIKFFADIVS